MTPKKSRRVGTGVLVAALAALMVGSAVAGISSYYFDTATGSSTHNTTGYTISFNAVDTGNNGALAGVLVTIAGMTGTTGFNGVVAISGIPAGTHVLVASMAGYNSFTDTIWVTADANQALLMVATPASPGKLKAAHPAAMMKPKEATPVPLGSATAANQRMIYKYIHPGGIQSCQLVMGFTALDKGSVWNSFPPHTHWRRAEIYFYFELGANVLSHFLGEPRETRHLFLHNEEVALSPNWSMHFGVGTASYKFIWGMAGENQVFDDMDAVKPLEMR
jgi:hypothetical protein